MNATINLPKHPGLFRIIKEVYDLQVLKAVRRYMWTTEKIACLSQHITFNKRCQRYHVLPRYLYQKTLVRTTEGYRIALQTGFKYLSARIRYDVHRIRLMKHDLYFQRRELQSILSPAHLNSTQEFAEGRHRCESEKCKTRQKAKFEKLISKIRNDLQRDLPEKWVVNRSSRVLNTPEKSLLSKGLNFAPAPRKSRIPETIAEIESALSKSKVNSTTADDIRTRIVRVLSKPIRPYRNLSPEEEEVLYQNISLLSYLPWLETASRV